MKIIQVSIDRGHSGRLATPPSPEPSHCEVTVAQVFSFGTTWTCGSGEAGLLLNSGAMDRLSLSWEG